MIPLIITSILSQLISLGILVGIVYLVVMYVTKRSIHLNARRIVSELLAIAGFLFLAAPTAAYIAEMGEDYALLTILGMGIAMGALAYRWNMRWLLFAAIVSTASIWFYYVADWIDSSDIRAVAYYTWAMLLVVLGYLLSRLHESTAGYKAFGMSYRVASFFLGGSLLIHLSTDAAVADLEYTVTGAQVFESLPLIGTLAAMYLAVAALGFGLYKRQGITRWETLLLLLLTLIVTGMLALPESLILTNDYWDLNVWGLVTSAVFNIVTLVVFVSIILLGESKGNTWTTAIGIFLTFIWASVKYTEWFFEEMNRGLFFIVAGAVVAASGYLLYRNRLKKERSN